MSDFQPYGDDELEMTMSQILVVLALLFLVVASLCVIAKLLDWL